ncbi:MAG: bifunctional proline dehydrogenase/L-glutamate gamma-semialdehyde dehydrogenase PutA [Alphaproteobacteria bacterium]
MDGAAGRQDIDRREIFESYLTDETGCVRNVIACARLSEHEAQEIDRRARLLVGALRSGPQPGDSIDAFMREYGLSSAEGVALMGLAEALLRIPDQATVDALIRDKIGTADWAAHLGHSESMFVNAATWALMLGGRVVGPDPGGLQGGVQALTGLVARAGGSLVRAAVVQAMRLLSEKFVIGPTIEDALGKARTWQEQGYRFSFDMLGEAALTQADAEHFAGSYAHAIDAMGQSGADGDVAGRPDISIKLSALHPRYEPYQRERVMAELVPRLRSLVGRARSGNVGVTIDAEEARSLDLGLAVIEAVAKAPEAAGWNGLGFALQAYSKRALAVIDWAARIAHRDGRQWPLRLVKGAYWDSEIKWAQQLGLDDYPVFTLKAATDVSYLACARRILADRQAFMPRFATHNAHTLTAVSVMAGAGAGIEFQRLYGMGEALYNEAIGHHGMGFPCRIYAPVGSYDALLPYLMRRLLENGANTSFVNRLVDQDTPVAEVVSDPVARLVRATNKRHPRIPTPPRIYGSERLNSAGLLIAEPPVLTALQAAMAEALAGPVVAAPIIDGQTVEGPARPVLDPADRRRVVGHLVSATVDDVGRAAGVARRAAPDWNARGGVSRADILERAAELFERRRATLMALCIREGGKTVPNALAELREAVDYLRYYAARARAEFAAPMPLPGPTGEANHLGLQGRGVFTCISPWNFPVAILTGQIAAALAAGNAVLAKPAEHGSLAATEVVRLLHQAGVPSSVLHLLTGSARTIGLPLVERAEIAGVALTGSGETARTIAQVLAARPGPIVPFIAETGGINAMIVDSTAQMERTVIDAVRSAFDSSGQRCSSLRLLFLQDEIADSFVRGLVGRAAELRIGDPMEIATDIGPLIDDTACRSVMAHAELLEHRGRRLFRGQRPAAAAEGNFVPPAIFEIDDAGWLREEVFGPILHVVRFRRDRLSQVCKAINDKGYGLTLSLHSRIDSVVEQVRQQVRVGNLYVNRDQIGAVVGTQPFGGEGLSGTGPKAGGPYYLHRFAVERSMAVNLTASGGDVALFAAEPPERDMAEAPADRVTAQSQRGHNLRGRKSLP